MEFNVESVITVVSAIVALTPTQKDDGFLGRINNLIRVLFTFWSKK